MPGQSLEARWARLSARYLPHEAEDSVWRYSRVPTADDPEQGWKLHISATVLSANEVLKSVAPFLCRSGLLFKAPRTLHELHKINAGLFYGFSQVGKFITVYPQQEAEALRLLARELHRLTGSLHGPVIPYNQPFCASTRVFYRYGAFRPLEMEQADGTRVSAIRSPTGELLPDSRGAEATTPAWATNPFENGQPKKVRRRTTPSPLQTTFCAYEALTQRGKGGVYRALDLSVSPARLCVLKEGRRHGETDWNGRDGYWRARHEGRVLAALSAAGINVPEVYSAFRVGGHYYLALEFIDGRNLQSLLSNKRKKLPLAQALRYGIQLAQLLHKIHAANWVWRDCKPLNLIVSQAGILRPIDFEGACRARRSDAASWGTPGYVPPEWRETENAGSKVPEDLYALGATLY